MAQKVQYCLHTFVPTQYLSVPLRTSQCFSRTANQIFMLSLHGDDKIISSPLPGSLNNVFPILLVVRTLKTHPLHWVHQQGAIPRPTQQCRELLPVRKWLNMNGQVFFLRARCHFLSTASNYTFTSTNWRSKGPGKNQSLMKAAGGSSPALEEAIDGAVQMLSSFV